jgi:HAD superfamily hydrolase (TIGR01549 family)
LDGTIVSLEFDIVGSRKAIISMLRDKGIDVIGLDYHTPTQLFLEKIKSGLSPQTFQKVREEVFSLLDNFEISASAKTHLLDDALDTLKRLRKAGIEMGLVTNTGRKAFNIINRRLNLDCLFSITLTRDDVPAMKPSPDGLQIAVDKMKCIKERTFYVGDSIYDARAAKSCGIKFIGVTSGNYDRERLLREGADIVIGELSELKEIFHV